jgi:hypothetical protein
MFSLVADANISRFSNVERTGICQNQIELGNFFAVKQGLKQGDGLSLLVSNLA